MSATTEPIPAWRDLLQALPWLIPAVATRVWVQLTGRCILDSDEGIKGLVMIEALRGEFRAFFHGQDYLGSLPWIIGSPGMFVVGANPNGLRFFYLLFLICILLMWRSILRHMGAAGAWPWFAILVGIAPAFIIEWTMRARGTVEGLLAGSAWLWVVVYLLSRDRPFEESRRWLFLLGVLTGIAWWTTQLTIFFFVPGALLLLTNKQVLQELRNVFSRPCIVIWFIALALTATVFLRASLHYTSPFQDHLWNLRVPLFTAWAVAIAATALLALYSLLPRWPWCLLGGLILGYLPVLLVVWFKEELYNTTSLQPLHALSGNFWTFLLVGSLDLMGVGSDREHWSIVTAMAAIFSAAVMLASVSLVALSVIRSLMERRRPERIDLFLLAAAGWALAFYMIAAPAAAPLGHYGTFPGFILLLIMAVFLWRLSLINRWGAIAVLALLLTIHLFSIVQMPRSEIEWRTGVERDDAAVIQFLLDRDITIAATSLIGTSSGYWEAYRLTFSSGERLRVHPILHMPRVDRYRVALREAERTAIVTIQPGMVTQVMDEAGLHYETTVFGRLTVIHDFDKAEADRLGLFDYRQRLDE